MIMRMEEVEWIVAGLLMNRAPKMILLNEATLESYYPDALQEWIDYTWSEHGVVFKEQEGMKQRVMDNVYRHQEHKRARLGL
jgi:hypothetical protein